MPAPTVAAWRPGQTVAGAAQRGLGSAQDLEDVNGRRQNIAVREGRGQGGVKVSERSQKESKPRVTSLPKVNSPIESL